ncbi:MAG: hypothetical protein ACC707_04330, partial [Thiohalomonadales bacterium]
GLLAETANALEVDRDVTPRITLGGRIISSLDDVNQDSDPEAKGEINLEDSSLLLRFDKRMYKGGVAGAVIGLADASDDGKPETQFHELHAFYWNQNSRFTLGQTRLRNTLIELPLLRDDDFLTYSHVGSASSNLEFDQIYAKQFAADWYVDKKIQSIGVWTGTRNSGINVGSAVGGFNSRGLTYAYQQPEDLLFVKRVRQAGIMIDQQRVRTVSGKEEWMTAIIIGGEININRNPSANWSTAAQLISNQGVDGITLDEIKNSSTNTVSARAAAKSNAFVGSFRYTDRTHLLTRWQASVNFAYKDYSDLSSASQWSIAPTYVYRLGQGVDILGQAIYTDFSSGLGDGSDTVVQLGIAFSLESVFNDTIGTRDSILNLEHGYIN